MKKPTVEELAAFVAKHISYDASLLSEGVKCPHCGQMAREPYYNRWIDHRAVLAGDICRFLGLKIFDQMNDILEHIHVDEDDKDNAKRIAEAVLKEVYE